MKNRKKIRRKNYLEVLEWIDFLYHDMREMLDESPFVQRKLATCMKVTCKNTYIYIF